MISKYVKTIILSAAFALMFSMSAFAAPGTQFPFDVEFDTDEIDRLCYAGHDGNTVEYADGTAILPETSFIVNSNGNVPDADVSNLSVEISLIYENDNNDGSHRETVKKYKKGSLTESERFPVLSGNIIASLDERGKLYSDQFKGLVMSLKCDGRETHREDIYLYVCPEDDFYGYIME